MKFLVLLFLILITLNADAVNWKREMAIGGDALDDSAAFQINSTSKGAVYSPVMTEAQRDAIASPTAGLGVFNSDDGFANLYDGSTWLEFIFSGSTQVLTNKTIDSSLNTITNIVDADLSAGADVTRTKLAPGTANYVLINDGSGEFSEEQYLDKTRGGTGITSTATFPASGTVVTEEGPHTLTNTTLTAPVINGGALNGGTASTANVWYAPSDTKANLDSLCPSLSAGSLVYATDEGTYYVCDGSTLEGLGSGGGGTGINYLSNSGAEETDISNFVAFADTGIGEDMTGGSPTSTITRNTTTPLRGVADFQFVKAVSAQYEGFSTDFTIAPADQTNIIRVAFEYNTDDANYDDGDMRVYIYNVDSAVSIELPVRDLPANARGKYEAYFQAAAGDTNYRLGFIVNDAVADSYTVYFDNIEVGPANLFAGLSDTGLRVTKNDAQSFTGTVTIEFDDVEFDNRAGYDATTNYNYTIPESGLYYISYNVNMEATSGTISNWQGWFQVNDSGFYGFSIKNPVANGDFHTMSGYGLKNLAKGDTIRVQISSGGGSSQTGSTSADGSGLTIFKIKADGATSAGKVTSFHAYNASGFSVPNNVNTKVTTGWTVQDDSLGNWDGDDFVVAESGRYLVMGGVLYGATMAVGTGVTAQVRRNGNLIAQGYTEIPDATIIRQSIPRAVAVEFLEKGDLIALHTFQNSGAAKTLDSGSGTGRGSFLTVIKLNGESSGTPTSKIRLKYQSNDGQSIPDTTNTTVTYENKVFDSHNIFNPSTGIATLPRAAYCQIDAQVRFNSATWGASQRIQMQGNGTGSTTQRVIQRFVTAGTYGPTTTKYSDYVYFEKGDTFYVEVSQNSGGPVAIVSSNSDNHIFMECD